MSGEDSDCSSWSFSTAPNGANDSPYAPDSPVDQLDLDNLSSEDLGDSEILDNISVDDDEGLGAGNRFDDISLEDDEDLGAGNRFDDISLEEDEEDEEGNQDVNEPSNISEGWDEIDRDEDVNYEMIPEDMLAYLRRRDPEHVAFDEGAVYMSSAGLDPDPEVADHWVVTGGGHRHQETYSFERDYPELAPLIRRVVQNPTSRPAREAMLRALRRTGRLRENAENTIMPVVDLFRGIGRGLAEIAEETANAIEREYLQDLSIRIQESAFWRRY